MRALTIDPSRWYLEAARSLLLATPSPTIWGGMQTVELGQVVDGVAERKSVPKRIVKFDTLNLVVATFDPANCAILTLFPLAAEARNDQTRQQMLALHHARILTFFSRHVAQGLSDQAEVRLVEELP